MITECFYKSKSYLYFIVLKSTSIGVHKKHSYCLSTHLYDQLYFDRRVQFTPQCIQIISGLLQSK